MADPVVKRFTYGFCIAGLLMIGLVSFVFLKYSHLIDKRMAGPVFSNAARIYARPFVVKVGDKLDKHMFVETLRRSHYTEAGSDGDPGAGSYRVVNDDIEVRPGSTPSRLGDAAVIHFKDDAVSGISTVDRINSNLDTYTLEPALVTALSETQIRSKRKLVTFDEIPRDLVNAVVAIEDRRFFQHSGVNYFRLLQAATTDILHMQRTQGGSTLTMQLSRGFFLTPAKTFERKASEILIAILLEQRFSKQKIFEMYANEVSMGQSGTFGISGFGEAAHAYFNKDIRNLTLSESAMLAGILQRPSYLSPFRYPERALKRRNMVLDAMVANRGDHPCTGRAGESISPELDHA